jgi:hypothetical protein
LRELFVWNSFKILMMEAAEERVGEGLARRGVCRKSEIGLDVCEHTSEILRGLGDSEEQAQDVAAATT